MCKPGAVRWVSGRRVTGAGPRLGRGCGILGAGASHWAKAVAMSGKRGLKNHGGEGWGGPSVGRGPGKYPPARCRLPLRSLFQLESPPRAVKGQPRR